MLSSLRRQPVMAGVAGGAILGLIASLVLSREAILLAENKSTVLSCSLNAVINCATVANHWSATIFGMPNSFIGLMTFPVVLMIAVLILSGVKLPTWFMRLTQLGVTLGLIFASWMFYMSFVEIQVLCLWCLLTDLSMLIIFFGVTRHNILSRNCFDQGSNKKLIKLVEKSYDLLLMWAIVVLLIAAIIAKFGSELFA